MDEQFRPPMRDPHRFVPTLTEVVQPDAWTPVASAPEISQALLEDIVDRAFRQAEDALTQRLPEVLAVMLHEQALAMSERLRADIRSAVRQSVATSLSEMLPGWRVQPGGSDAGTGEKQGERPE